MGTSFVELGSKGFWMQDNLLCVWLRLAALHIECGSNAPDVLTRVRNEWMLQSQICATGIIATDLDSIAGDDAAKEAVAKAIRQVQSLLDGFGSVISPEILNLLGSEGHWVAPLETARLQEIAKAFLDLIEGKIETEANSTDFMPGTRV